MLDFLNVSKHFGAVRILEDSSFRVNDGDHIGLVGANGSGKTTVFRLIAGMESPDEGQIQKKRSARIGYLPQEVDPFETGTVLDEVLKAAPEYRDVVNTLDLLDAALAQGSDDEAAQRRAFLTLRFEELGGDSVKARACEILAGLGFAPADMGRALNTLSGGWHVRVLLGRLLLSEPDLLLLDEPTNHLDLPSMLWFESYLSAFKGAYIIVSHDREFLNRTISRAIEVDNGKLTTYTGNWDDYRKKKEEAIELQLKAFATQQAKIRDIEDFIARNRVRKDRARQVQSRLKALEKLEVNEAPVTSREIDFQFPQPFRSGNLVFKVEGLRKCYGDKVVFNGIDVNLQRGDKVAVVGVNGIGKSTLLKIAVGAIGYEGGTRELGHNVTVGYFAQHQLEALNPDLTVFQEILQVSRDETVSQLRSLLGAFLFSGDDVEKKVAVLSGGEKSRLALAKLLLKPANFLVMDEPTNHLDIASREVLEEALRQYQGTILFASHDRRFIDAIANRVLEMEHGIPTDYPGNYSDYAWKKSNSSARPFDGNELGDGREASAGAQATREPRTSDPSVAADPRKEKKRREAEMRQEIYRTLKPLTDRISALESEIQNIETDISTLETELADPATYGSSPDLVKRRGVTLAARRRDLEDRMARWEETSLKAERMEAEIRSKYDATNVV